MWSTRARRIRNITAAVLCISCGVLLCTVLVLWVRSYSTDTFIEHDRSSPVGPVDAITAEVWTDSLIDSDRGVLAACITRRTCVVRPNHRPAEWNSQQAQGSYFSCRGEILDRPGHLFDEPSPNHQKLIANHGFVWSRSSFLDEIQRPDYEPLAVRTTFLIAAPHAFVASMLALPLLCIGIAAARRRRKIGVSRRAHLMVRVQGWLFHGSAALSLHVAIFLIGVSVYSHWRDVEMILDFRPERSFDSQEHDAIKKMFDSAWARGGRIAFEHFAIYEPVDPDGRHSASAQGFLYVQPLRASAGANPMFRGVSDRPLFRFGGFSLYHTFKRRPRSTAQPDSTVANRGWESRYFGSAPGWFVALLFGLLPLRWLVIVRRRRKVTQRKRQHLCVQCGYDLRACSERCPECGLVAN